MFRNYLVTALRNLVRNRFYAAINIVGLAVGFAAAIFAALFVRYELTYNQWISGHARTYTIITSVAMARGNPPTEWTWAYRDVAAWLKLDFPEVEFAARIRPQWPMVVRHGDVREEERVSSADSNFFNVIPFPVRAGDLANALLQPDSVVLTRSMARKYFGQDAPIGEILDLDQHPMRVAAVIEDYPANTYFPGSIGIQIFISAAAPFSSLREWDEFKFTPELDPGEMVQGGTFVRLREGASIDAIQGAMPDFVQRRIPRDLLGDVKMQLMPIAALHVPPINNPSFAALKARFWSMILGVVGIGVLIVLASAINYVNAMTARTARRAVEVGVRKVTGAARLQLIVQFMGEAVIYAAVAMALAVGIVLALMPSSAGFLDRTIIFSPGHDTGLISGIILVALTTGGLAGVYPALVLSALRPAAVLKAGAAGAAGSGVLRQALVTLQFAILIGITAVAGVIYRQTDFAINQSLHFDKDRVLFVGQGCIPALKAEVEKLPGVRAVACGEIRGGGYKTVAERPDGNQVNEGIAFQPIDAAFFDVFGLTPRAGQLFPHERGDAGVDDDSTVVINETAARKLGFPSPEAAVGQVVSWRHVSELRKAVDTIPFVSSLIAGVVSDYAVSVTNPVGGEIYFQGMSMLTRTPANLGASLNVKLTGNEIPATLQAIDHLWAQIGNPDRPIRRLFVDQIVEEAFRDLTQQSHLIAVLASVALFTAALGVFGLAAFTAERRTKEIGVRKALGARKADILRLMLWEFTKPVLWANLIAWPTAYIFTHAWLQGFTYRIDIEPWVFLMASSLALLIAVLTVAGHALLVARAQPVTALRYE